jgi:hypothetical protein
MDRLNGRLITNLQKRKMKIGYLWFVYCENEVNTILHLLRDCPKSMVLWINVVLLGDRIWFFNARFLRWMEIN